MVYLTEDSSRQAFDWLSKTVVIARPAESPVNGTENKRPRRGSKGQRSKGVLASFTQKVCGEIWKINISLLVFDKSELKCCISRNVKERIKIFYEIEIKYRKNTQI